MQMFYQYMRFEILMVVIITTVTMFGLVERDNVSGKPTASIIYPENADCRFLRIVGMYLLNYMALHPKDKIILMLSIYLRDHL